MNHEQPYYAIATKDSLLSLYDERKGTEPVKSMSIKTLNDM